jgi:anti-sigma28 factor (negative regulator of flagellin synthesis)
MTLSDEKIEKMWQAYQVHPTTYSVGKKCNVSRSTVRRYRDSEHWDERRQEIRDKASALADNKAAQRLANAVEVVHDLRVKIAESIKERIEAGSYKPTVMDLERLVKLEQFLSGLSDSHTEQAVSFKWFKVDNDEDKGDHEKPDDPIAFREKTK